MLLDCMSGGTSMIKLYGYKKCGTCRKAEKHLESKGLSYKFIDITTEPPSERTLKSIIKRSGQPLKAFYNTSGVQYKELDIKNKKSSMSEAEQVSMLSGNGKLIKRPLIDDGKQASVGFKSEVEEV